MKSVEKPLAAALTAAPSSPAAANGSAGAGASTAQHASRGMPPAPAPPLLDRGLNALIGFFTSLRLTVACLAMGLVLVFFGTMAQDPMGLFLAQEKFFRSLFVPAAPMWAAIKKTLEMGHIYLPPSTVADVMFGSQVPVFPGGYLLGGLLLLNLIASHFKRFKLTRAKVGIWMTHFGLILLLAGQLGTDLFSRESVLHLREGEAKNYSESNRQVELAVVDTTDPDTDKVVAIAQPRLMREGEVRVSDLPFRVRVKKFYMNSEVEDLGAKAGTQAGVATQGVGPRATVKELPRVTAMDQRDVPSAIVELVSPQGSLGTWLVSEYINQPQRFTYQNRSYELAMRVRRYYKPYTIQLLRFQHDVYPGTDIPKNFSSRVRLARPDTGEAREVLIHMNSPLRYAGETYYQQSFDADDHGSILQVVHNPGWLTPYFSCILVGLGLVVQFATHLLGFTVKRKSV